MEQPNNNHNYLNMIRSVYILKQVTEYTTRNKLLPIINFNKALQEKLNIGIDDYKDLCDKIKIELIPINKNNTNKFIKMIKNSEQYYHIYFNDDNNEIHRDYFNSNEQVYKIRIIIDKEIKSLGSLFYKCYCIQKINFLSFYRKDITNMSHMFRGCSSLIEVNLNNFRTTNVTDMGNMFMDCPSLKKLNLYQFNTSNVINMNCMFQGCSSIKELNLNNFNTEKVANMWRMFYGCKSLVDLSIDNFNINNVSSMTGMFYGCNGELIDKLKEKNNNIIKKEMLEDEYLI